MITMNHETSNETAILFVCNCCGRIAKSQTQPSIIPGRAALIQIECKTAHCHNENWTYTFRAGDDNEQCVALYTPVTMAAGQVERFVAAVGFTAIAHRT